MVSYLFNLKPIIVLILFISLSNVKAQDKQAFYAYPAIGTYNYLGAEAGFSGGLAMNYHKSDFLYSVSFYGMSEFSIFGERPDETLIWNVLYGKRSAKKLWRFDAQGGLSLVMLNSYVYDRSIMETVKKINFTIGLSAKVGISAKLTKFVAIGVDGLVGINTLSSYYLIPMIKLEIGKIY